MNIILASVFIIILLIIATKGNQLQSKESKRTDDQNNQQTLRHYGDEGTIKKVKDKNKDKYILNPEYGQILKTKKGEIVRSKGEMKIANYLYKNQIDYIYEPELKGISITPDFLLTKSGTIIEYFGMIDVEGQTGEQYRENMKRKIREYKNQDIDLLSLVPKDLNKLGDKIHKK